MISVAVPGRIQGCVCQISSSGSSVPRGAEYLVVSWIVQDLELGWQVPGDDSVRFQGIFVFWGSYPATREGFVPEELFWVVC